MINSNGTADGVTRHDEQPERETDSRLVDQMQSEIAHLRDQLSSRDTQIDQLNQILAMTSAQTRHSTGSSQPQETYPRPIEIPVPFAGIKKRRLSGKKTLDTR